MTSHKGKQVIKVNFYKDTGKWYAGGDVEVNHYLFDDNFRQDIVNNQNILQDGWQGNYYVVTSGYDHDNVFVEQLFPPHRFLGIKKNNTYNEVI